MAKEYAGQMYLAAAEASQMGQEATSPPLAVLDRSPTSGVGLDAPTSSPAPISIRGTKIGQGD